MGAVCLGLVVGRLCVGLLTGLVVRGDVGPVGRREAVDVIDCLGGFTPLACSCRPPRTPLSRLSPPLFPTSALPFPPLAASSRPPRWPTLLVRACVLLPRRVAFLPRRVAFHRSVRCLLFVPSVAAAFLLYLFLVRCVLACSFSSFLANLAVGFRRDLCPCLPRPPPAPSIAVSPGSAV